MVDALAGRIETIEIEDEMRSSYIDYAMSVIVGRALPDVRDGLKPVHRRILYGMHGMGVLPGKPYKKCARIVGDVMGKYHPHGDSAIYDTLVRMAQDFSMRYELIDGHGNFGSVDGDSPAAMRYTEARLSKLAVELLRDIDKKTVDFVPNYDESEEEPVVLPARFPNLLVNGSSGIAVGMATNIPPHNINEVIDAAIMLIDNPGATVKELMQHIKGPDFPTGGIIMGRSNIRQAYETGRGSIKVRGKAHVEQTKSNKTRIIVSELPYQVNKARLTEKIAELVREKKIGEISDLRDESDRSGMRLVIELKREAIPQVVLNKLYKHTQLEVSFGIIMLALVNGIPQLSLTLPQLLHHYIEHQKEVVIRRTKFELAKAEARAHIIEGLLVALSNLDAVIKMIRESKTVDEARRRLMRNFKLTEIQAQAILDMRLQRLTALERQKIEQEYKELLERIAYLKSILTSEQMVLDIIKDELTETKTKFGDARRTQITSAAAELEIEDLIAEEDMVITITRSGYIKRLPVTTYRQQARGGKGVSGMNLKEGDFVEHLFISSTHNYILFFSNKGKVYKLKVHELPIGSRTARGQAIVNVLPFTQDEKIAAVISTKTFEEDQYLMMSTKNGLVKKTPFREYDTSRRDGILAITMREDDELIGVKITRGADDIILVSKKGMSIRFHETDARPMGRTATGVRGMALEDDEVLAIEVARDEADLLIITVNGYGKRTPMNNYPVQGRGGKGVKTLKDTSTRGSVAAAKMVQERHGLMVVSSEGIVIRTPVKQISQMGRNTQGVKIMNLNDSDEVSAVALITHEKNDQVNSV
ncbi:MAG: DNA gyrase subunit A [Actinobacteria bacterium]|nr:DNA gyrase subunit A [Actinomycetota bacterium]